MSTLQLTGRITKAAITAKKTTLTIEADTGSLPIDKLGALGSMCNEVFYITLSETQLALELDEDE